MFELVIFLLFAALLGALLGGDSFGESTRRGCGCLVLLCIIFFIPLTLYGLFMLLTN